MDFFNNLYCMQFLFLKNNIRMIAVIDDVQRLNTVQTFQLKSCERNNLILFQVFRRKTEKLISRGGGCRLSLTISFAIEQQSQCVLKILNKQNQIKQLVNASAVDDHRITIILQSCYLPPLEFPSKSPFRLQLYMSYTICHMPYVICVICFKCMSCASFSSSLCHSCQVYAICPIL